jgi:hypothetical protein
MAILVAEENIMQYPVIHGNNTQILSAANCFSLSSAMRQMHKMLLNKSIVGTIQVGFSPDEVLVLSRTEATSDWKVETSPVWTPEQVEEYNKALATLVVPVRNTRANRFRLGWGYARWVKEMFAEKFGIAFEGEGTLSSDSSSLVYRCQIPVEADRALKESYGCSVVRDSLPLRT